MRPRSIWKTWTDVTLAEMKAYLGVVMNMAINGKSSVQDYFSRDWIKDQPFFRDVFSRDRFLQIHWMLHVNPPAPAEQNSQNRGYKVKNVVEYIQKKNLEHFIPDREIAVDESTIGFKGRVAWKMYNPQKPTKWGLRVFALCDSATGYVCTFEPYYGQQTTQTLPYADQQFPVRIVLYLVDQLLQNANGDGFHLYTDRYYTNPRLAAALL